MRIQSQRETFALRVRAASEFPWRPEDRDWAHGEYGLYGPGVEAYHAPLENGHRLRVWDDTNNEDQFMFPKEAPGSHWKGGIDEGEDFPNDPQMPGYPNNTHPNWTAAYEEDSPLRAKAYPSKEEAMRGVEKKYREKFPIGTNTGPHDSGVDYSDLNSVLDQHLRQAANDDDDEYIPSLEEWMYRPDPDGGEPERTQLEFEPWQNNELPRPQRGNQDPDFLRNNVYLPDDPTQEPSPGLLWPSRGPARQWWKETPESLADWQEQIDRRPGQDQMDLFGDADYQTPPDFPSDDGGGPLPKKQRRRRTV